MTYASLCGRRSCPGACTRVCHCSAGLARSHQLLGMYRNRHLVLRGGFRSPLPQSEPRPLAEPLSEPWLDITTGEISKPRQALRQLRSKVMTRANFYHYHAGCTRSQALKLSWAEYKQVTTPAKHHFGILNQPQRRKPSKVLPTYNWEQAALPYIKKLQPYASAVILTVLLLFMGIVVALGLTFNGGNFSPGYEPPKIYYQE